MNYILMYILDDEKDMDQIGVFDTIEELRQGLDHSLATNTNISMCDYRIFQQINFTYKPGQSALIV